MSDENVEAIVYEAIVIALRESMIYGCGFMRLSGGWGPLPLKIENIPYEEVFKHAEWLKENVIEPNKAKTIFGDEE